MGAPFWAAHPSLGGCLLLLYIEVWSSLFLTHLSLSPSSRSSTFRPFAWRSHGRLVSPPHHAVVLLEFLVVLLLPLPRWIEGTEVVIKPYMWPSTEALPVAAFIFAILRSASDRLHCPRESFSKRFRSSRVSSLGTWFYPLLTSTRLDLGVLDVFTVGFFCFLCYEPINYMGR